MIGSSDNRGLSEWMAARSRRRPFSRSCSVALGAAVAAPFVPNDAALILERLPPRDGAAWDEIRALHAALAQNPADASVAAELARRYLDAQSQRRRSAPRRLREPRARALGRKLAAPPVDVALERALIAQTEHRFDAARARARRSCSSARRARRRRGWRSPRIDTVQGRYADAKRSCARLVLLQDAVVAGACFAAVQAMTGEAAAAYRFLTESLARPESLDAGVGRMARDAGGGNSRATRPARGCRSALSARRSPRARRSRASIC